MKVTWKSLLGIRLEQSSEKTITIILGDGWWTHTAKTGRKEEDKRTVFFYVFKGEFSRTPQGGVNLQRCVYKRPSQATVAERGRC